MSVETSRLRQAMLGGNHNTNPGAAQGLVTSLSLLALLALRGGALYGHSHEICVRWGNRIHLVRRPGRTERRPR